MHNEKTSFLKIVKNGVIGFCKLTLHIHTWATLGGGQLPPKCLVVESPMSAPLQLERLAKPRPGCTGVLGCSKYPQTKAKAIEELANYSTRFCSVEQCSQSQTYLLIS